MTPKVEPLRYTVVDFLVDNGFPRENAEAFGLNICQRPPPNSDMEVVFRLLNDSMKSRLLVQTMASECLAQAGQQ